MENIDNLLDMWKQDCEIDSTEPGRELLKIPKYHVKYLKILTSHRLILKKIDDSYKREKKIKWSYYSGHFNSDPDMLKQLGLEPFRLVLKSDISTYLDSDPQIISILDKKTYCQEIISTCESIISELKSRTYQLRDFISYEKFINGA